MPGYTLFRISDGAPCYIVLSENRMPGKSFPGEVVSGNPRGIRGQEVTAKVLSLSGMEQFEGMADENGVISADVDYIVYPRNDNMAWLLEGMDAVRRERDEVYNDPAVKAARRGMEVAEEVRMLAGGAVGAGVEAVKDLWNKSRGNSQS